MRTSLVTLAVAVALAGASVTAQSLGTDFFTGHTSGRILRSTLGGPTTSVGTMSFGFFINGLTMDSDNRTLVALDSLRTPTAVIRVDPVAGAIIGTVYSGAPFTNVQSWIDVDDDGDYLVADRTELFKVDRNGGRVTTLLSDPAGYWFAFCEDKSTGNYLLGDFSSRKAILTLDRDTLTVTSIVPIPNSITGMMQDPHGVDVYCSGSHFLRFNPQTFVVSTLGAPLGRTSANVGGIDRAPAPNGGLLYGGLTSGDVIQLDRQGNVLGTVAMTGGGSCLGFTFDKSRNLGPVLIGPPNNRQIRVSFPGDSGNQYVLGFGLSGNVPGFTLPDGRVIPVNLDTAVFASAQGLLGPAIRNNPGLLDAFGEATVPFDVSALGRSVNGVRVWIAAVTLDPAQPFGISQISAPLLIVL